MKRRGVVVGVAIAAAVVVGVGAAVFALTRPPSVEDSAMAYLDALASGQIAAVESIGAGPSEDADVAGEAFSGAKEYLSDPSVDGVEDDGGGLKAVSVSFDLAGERRTTVVLMGLSGGRWVPAGDYLGTITATTSVGDSVTVGGAVVLAGTPVSLLPAAYDVEATPGDVLDGSADAVVVPGTALEVSVEAVLSPDANSLTQARLDGYLDQCTAPATTLPDACGIRIPWAADLASLDGLEYRIEERPAIELQPADGTFSATGGVLVATARGTTHDGTPGEFTYRADDWALYGTLTFAGSEMLLSVR